MPLYHPKPPQMLHRKSAAVNRVDRSSRTTCGFTGRRVLEQRSEVGHASTCKTERKGDQESIAFVCPQLRGGGRITELGVELRRLLSTTKCGSWKSGGMCFNIVRLVSSLDVLRDE